MGAVDSIVDIVGAAIGFHYFRFQTIVVSPLPITRGFVRTAHGRYPVPPPAVLELIKDAAIVPSPVRGEIVTPTGAAVLTTVAGAFGECPLRAVTRIGYGVGDKHFRSIPNVLRLLIGEGAPVVAIESNIDDANPQIYDYLIDELLRVGALDVVVRPILMKKRRPAAQVQILCEELKREALIRCLLRETTGFGVRWYPVQRRMLAREERMARTRHGPVRVKLGFSGLHPGEGELLQVSPEYEDCKRVARAKGIPLREIYRLAVAAAVR
ncbi:MAG: LarC family nickel insertion protein [Deltaproteobacteria bacterium]|nr:LarC family nickel insertion protein [Deltaproteobacteria bacterium]